MTTLDEQTLGDIDDLLIFAGGYLTALKRQSKNDKLVKRTEQTIQKIAKRYRKQIDELYAPAAPHPDAITFKK